mgnify:FL=1
MENKIGFFKKVWYSITNIKKYDEMTKQGLFSAIKYAMLLLAMLGIIMAGFETFEQIKAVNKSISYLEQNLPEFTINKQEINLQNEDTVILESEEMEKFFGCNIVIAQNLEENEAIEQYANMVKGEYSCLVFLKNEYVLITPKYSQDGGENGILKGEYSNEVSKYLGDSKEEYNKEDVMNYLKENISYTYYFVIDFVIYFLTLIILYVFFLFVVALSYILALKMTKIKTPVKQAISEVLYAETLSMIVYVMYILLSYILKFKFSFIYGINLLIVYIYMMIVIRGKKNAKK